MTVHKPFTQTQFSWYTLWLWGGMTLLIAMVLLGGATRLHHAGLSIVEWELFKGILPPLTVSQWQSYFNLYQQSEEYKQLHSWMTLNDFKAIFWFEYAHRLLGRIIGLWFLLPTVAFNFTYSVSLSVKKNLFGIAVLILTQGFIGWYMVKSGLSKDATVSHYRLVLHLMTALMVISWVTKMLVIKTQASFFTENPLPMYGLTFLCCLTTLYGGFVAGLKAGLIYNTFPLMEGKFFPSDGWFYYPKFLNFVKNPSCVQWFHRVLGTTSVLSAWGTYFYYKNEHYHRYFFILAFMLTVQGVLGISCLLTQLNFWIALSHQATAIGVWILISGLIFLQRKSTANL